MSTGLALFTVAHVVISLIGIGAGLLTVAGWIGARRMPMSTGIFLTTTVATSVTGFFFPFHGFKPSYVVGLLSLVILGVTYKARHHVPSTKGWRATYVITATLALYLNVFVLIVQSFSKISSLHALAPTQTENPFKITQLAALVLFILIGILATKRYPEAPHA